MAKVSSFQNKLIRRGLNLLGPLWSTRFGRRIGLSALILMLIWPVGAQAHSSGPPRLANAVAGPYLLFVWTQPDPLRIGDVHVSVFVTQQATDNQAAAQPVPDAQVELRFAPLDQSASAITAVATPQPYLGNLYHEADVQLRTAGSWRATISVKGVAGQGDVTFDSTVLPAHTLNWWLIGGAGAAFGLLLILIGVWSRMQASAQRATVKRG